MSTVPCVITILDTETGGLQSGTALLEAEFGGTVYDWSEGNYSCDCNRALFYNRARFPRKKIGVFDFECGGGRYRVRISDGFGKVLYSDMEGTDHDN